MHWNSYWDSTCQYMMTNSPSTVPLLAVLFVLHCINNEQRQRESLRCKAVFSLLVTTTRWSLPCRRMINKFLLLCLLRVVTLFFLLSFTLWAHFSLYSHKLVNQWKNVKQVIHQLGCSHLCDTNKTNSDSLKLHSVLQISQTDSGRGKTALKYNL